MAHRGVLFLDELPEFSMQVLDSLRQPLESGECVIARANSRVTYPARFQLIAAMNPCRCGMASQPGFRCARGPRCEADYRARISGPMLDRMDMAIDVPAVTATDLIGPGRSEPSATVAARVAHARAIQAQRYVRLGLESMITNALCPAALIEDIATPDAEGARLVREASDKLALSARAYHRVLRVSRTLADLDGSETVRRIHLAEAISWRMASNHQSRAA